MTFGLVMSANTQQKQPTSPNCEYKLFHTLTSTILGIYSVKDLILEKQKTNW